MHLTHACLQKSDNSILAMPSFLRVTFYNEHCTYPVSVCWHALAWGQYSIITWFACCNPISPCLEAVMECPASINPDSHAVRTAQVFLVTRVSFHFCVNLIYMLQLVSFFSWQSYVNLWKYGSVASSRLENPNSTGFTFWHNTFQYMLYSGICNGPHMERVMFIWMNCREL